MILDHLVEMQVGQIDPVGTKMFVHCSDYCCEVCIAGMLSYNPIFHFGHPILRNLCNTRRKKVCYKSFKYMSIKTTIR